MKNANLYGETELGGLSVMDVLPESASVFGLPEAPLLSTTNIFAQWLGGIINAGVIAAVPFWLLFKRKRGMETRAGAEENLGKRALSEEDNECTKS